VTRGPARRQRLQRPDLPRPADGSRSEAGEAPLVIGDTAIQPGEVLHLELPVARLFTGSWLALPVSVLHGTAPGPTLLLDAAIHGDELNGMEIIRRVLEGLEVERMRGAVVAVPVVNVFGFVQQNRYLPDRRDLNRSFPGSPRGSTASLLAHLFMEEVVSRCHYAIDLHTGSQHRSNLPQVRGHFDDPETRRLAEAFGAPMMYAAAEIPGSLRAAARRRGLRVLVYEAGEPLRFDEEAIAVGVDGVLRVLATLGMWEHRQGLAPPATFEASETRWLRAPRSGIFHLATRLGEIVGRHQALGFVTTPFPGGERQPIRAPFGGLVIGHTSNPLIHKGDALVHLARPAGRVPPRGEEETGD
jgi:uncharacterized protein